MEAAASFFSSLLKARTTDFLFAGGFMNRFKTLLYENPDNHIARIVLNRPETRNSQDTRMLYELNDAFDVAAQDDNIKVIILAGNGPHFSSGHDLREQDPYQNMAEFPTVG